MTKFKVTYANSAYPNNTILVIAENAKKAQENIESRHPLNVVKKVEIK